MAVDTRGFLKKAIEKIGLHREKYNEDIVPTDPSSITIIPFFGDLRSLFILSSLIFENYRIQEKSSRYLILCSWPGFSSLFPSVSEYWSLNTSQVNELYSSTCGFKNNSPLAAEYYRNLNSYFFEDVVFAETEFLKLYNCGLTDLFWEYKPKKFLPSISSSTILGNEFNRQIAASPGYKVFIYPLIFVPIFKLNSVQMFKVPKDFWSSLLGRLLKDGFVPVVCKGAFTYDLSLIDRCIHFFADSVEKTMTAMRAVGCSVDFFGGVSKLALAARCPFISFVERGIYAHLKDYEIDDLCGQNLPKQYIFSFPTIIESGNQEAWDFNLFDALISKLNLFLPSLDRETWPTTGESFELISRSSIRKRKQKHLGVKFIKINKD